MLCFEAYFLTVPFLAHYLFLLNDDEPYTLPYEDTLICAMCDDAVQTQAALHYSPLSFARH